MKTKFWMGLFLTGWLAASLPLPAAGKTEKEMGAVPTATPAPAPPAVIWKGVVQAWAVSMPNGMVNFLMKHVRVKAIVPLDAQNTLSIMPEYASTGFTLLDAFEVYQAEGIKGFSVMAGQFKFAFGDDRYLLPTQLKRVDYSAMDTFAFPGSPWDVGFELKEVTGPWTFQADVIQGAGPNVLVDTNDSKDISLRAEWKDKTLAIGLSDYYGIPNKTLFTSPQNWFGGHFRLMVEDWDFRGETILAPGNKNAFLSQVSLKPESWWEPVFWYETGLTNNVVSYNNLGLGLNLWPGSKTRISLDLAFVGIGDILSQRMMTLQTEQVF